MRKGWILAAVVACFAASMANADTWNKKSKVTFSGPIQVPGPHTSSGVITLPAGTYVFKLISSQSNRNIVEVQNEKQNKVFATILAINDYRVNASSKTIMYFSERKAGAPVAIKSWFYPGDNYGQRFVYPKVQATQIAAAVNQPVPSTTETVEVTKYVAVPVYIQTPAKQEVAYNANTFAKQDATDTAGDDGEAVKEPVAEAPKALPKTGSNLPLVGLSGLCLLAFSFLVRRAASQLR